MATELRIPLLNPNETEAVLVALHASEGQQIAPGDLLYTLETTKSTAEVILEGDAGGYLAGVQCAEGDTVSAGDLFGYLAETPDWQPPAPQAAPAAESDARPTGLRITDPALALARQHNLDLSQLPANTLVTASHIKRLIDQGSPADQPAAQAAPFDPTAIIVYGGGGHGKSVIELIQAVGGYRIVGLVDDGIPPGSEIMGLPVLGGSEVLAQLYADGVRLAANAVGGIGQVNVRVKVFNKIAEAGFACPALVHPTAFVEPSAVLSPGVQVFPHAYIGSEAQIGFGTIINTGAIVSHDCVLGDYVNLAPGAILAGSVNAGDYSLIGMGVTVNLAVQIGTRAQIGNSAVIKTDVPANGIVRAGSTQ